MTLLSSDRPYNYDKGSFVVVASVGYDNERGEVIQGLPHSHTNIVGSHITYFKETFSHNIYYYQLIHD
jgi:hypothetical protein